MAYQTTVSSSRAPGPIPVPLLVHSAYSLGRATATPEELLGRAEQLGLDHLALTDRDNLYGAVAFLRAAERRGIVPILGLELTPRSGGPVVPGADAPRGTVRGACAAPEGVLLLVSEPVGYSSLCRIVTARQLAPRFQLEEVVAAHAAGLVILVRGVETLRKLERLGVGEALHALIVRPGPAAPERELRAAAAACGRSVAGTIEVYGATSENRDAGRVLAAIREIDLVSRLPEDRFAPESSFLADPAEIFARFADDPACLAEARRIGESCCFASADLPAPGSLIPRLPLPNGETAYDRLYRMTQEGLRRRYRRVTREAASRLALEIEQIDAMGFTDYFVVVGDLCAAARARGIPTVGRGSGASSLVSYLLGITNVDPIRYRLTFERFLHRLRRDLPDLDIDLCWRRRDEVIAHVYETYGADRVAMISTHNHYKSRGAFREAAKALGLSHEQVDRYCRAIPAFSGESLGTALRSTPLGRTLDLETAPIPEAIRAADRLIGRPHTLGIHCGGIVIGPEPLDRSVPLEMATKGIVVTQYEMRAVEAVGLVKIDLLGNRALSTIAEASETIRAAGRLPPDPDALPHDDPQAARLLSRGETLGCFQIESPGMRNLLQMLETRDLEGTIAALSLIRPGPAGSGMKGRFIRRARGIEETTYLHPALEPLLAATHGVLLYEEDVLCVASAIGGFDRAVGDLLRRAIAAATAVAPDPSLGERPEASLMRGGGDAADPWKGRTMRELENRFVASAVGNGVDADVARAVWEELARFGSYAFCKAHASGYGLLAYATAYLKAHHPGPFYAALLNNHQGMYPLRVHVEEARRRKVPLAGPCIHRSQEGWTWNGSVLRCGLAQVRGLTGRTLAAILRERERAEFEDLGAFLARTGTSVPETSALIVCGALDTVGIGPRPARLWELHCRARAGRIAGSDATGSLGIAALQNARSGPWREFDAEEQVRQELETLDVAITAHPVRVLCQRLRREGRMPMVVPAKRIGKEGPVRVLGIVAAGRRVRTKKGESMLFLTLEDPTGMTECTLFPPVYRRYGASVDRAAVLLATGTVEAPYGAPTVTLERLERIL